MMTKKNSSIYLRNRMKFTFGPIGVIAVISGVFAKCWVERVYSGQNVGVIVPPCTYLSLNKN